MSVDVQSKSHLKTSTWRLTLNICLQDSYTDGGGKRDGTPLAPPIIIPPNAQAGGRSTNGKLWIENVADDIGATLMDYAVHFRTYPRGYILKLHDRRRVLSRISV